MVESRHLESIFRAALRAVDTYRLMSGCIELTGNLLTVTAAGERHEVDLDRFNRILVLGAGKASARPPNPPEESQMPRYKLVVMSGPQDGRAAEYHDWYQNSHLQQVMELPGFQAGQRYRLSTALIEGETFPFLAIYDIETDDVDSVLAEMRSRAGTERLTVSDALAPKAYAVLYEEFGARVTAKDSPS